MRLTNGERRALRARAGKEVCDAIEKLKKTIFDATTISYGGPSKWKKMDALADEAEDELLWSLELWRQQQH